MSNEKSEEGRKWFFLTSGDVVGLQWGHMAKAEEAEVAEIKVRPTPKEKADFEAAATRARQSLNQWMIAAGLEKLARENKLSALGTFKGRR